MLLLEIQQHEIFFSLEHMKIDRLMDGAVSCFWLQALSFVDKLTNFNI